MEQKGSSQAVAPLYAPLDKYVASLLKSIGQGLGPEVTPGNLILAPSSVVFK
jgi:hypothetical protein